MFLWLVGLTSSVSLLLLTSGYSTVIVTAPLWILGGVFCWWWLKSEDQDKSDNIDLFGVGVLWAALMITLHLVSLIDMSASILLLTIPLLGVFVMYIVRDNSLFYTDKYANWVSKLSFLIALVLFYGVEIHVVDRWVPLIPSATYVLSEFVVIYKLNQQNLTVEFLEKRYRDRVTSLCAVIVFIVLLVLHILYVFDSVTLYAFGIVVYGVGLAFIHRDFIKKVYFTMKQLRQQNNRQKLTMKDSELVGP